jgi:hypothetical protein
MGRWSVAIVSSRETIIALSACVRSVVVAAWNVPTSLDVMVNGNRQLAADLAAIIHLPEFCSSHIFIRIWYIPVADKANALNQYLNEIRPEADVTFFLDGYVQVMPEALKLMSESLAAKPETLAVSAVPTVGRSANSLRQTMLKGGGIHGNLFGVRREVCLRLRERGFRLPLGTYWTDGLMGAVFCFGLDPSCNDWESRRVGAHPQATWRLDPAVWWRPKDIRSYFRRRLRQAQGRLENRAIREHLANQRKTPESLPATSSELVEKWIAACPKAARQLFIRNPLCLLGLRKLRQPRDWSEATRPPELVT